MGQTLKGAGRCLMTLEIALTPDGEHDRCARTAFQREGTACTVARSRQASSGLVSLRANALSHDYGAKRALAHVGLSVAAGEIVCLVGPSGCGKSTLLRLIAGLERLQAGSIHLGERLMADHRFSLPPEKRGIGLVFQDYALFPHLSVVQNVRFGLDALPKAARTARAMAALRQVGMEGQADQYPHALSGGQQQRVALARAMAPAPAVLLLDEPFSGLDARLRESIRDETLHVLKQSGAATVVVTHDPEEAMFLADRIALMHEGHIVQLGAPEDLYMRPVSAFAAGFFGETNEMAATPVALDRNAPAWCQDALAAVRTPLGVLPLSCPPVLPPPPPGRAWRAMLRPEGVHLTPDRGGVATGCVGLVEAARFLGRSSLIHLCLAGVDGQTRHVHARVPGRFLPQEGESFPICIDMAHFFVFPA
jgi:iron(III) transport system ATP-binding protein